MLCYILILYRVISYHIIIISYHIISYHIISYHQYHRPPFLHSSSCPTRPFALSCWTRGPDSCGDNRREDTRGVFNSSGTRLLCYNTDSRPWSHINPWPARKKTGLKQGFPGAQQADFMRAWNPTSLFKKFVLVVSEDLVRSTNGMQPWVSRFIFIRGHYNSTRSAHISS